MKELHGQLEPSMKKKPSFLIVGAMKCATTTLYDQLKLQAGIFMPELKEPNFFSDDEIFNLGQHWYENLFDAANPGDILGEASTHYTKLPTYPETISRIQSYLGTPKIIYVMREPVDRLVSQYIHEWSCGKINVSIDEAIVEHPELIKYSLYHYQIKPYLEAFGRENVLPVFFEKLKKDPQEELNRIARFIGAPHDVEWKKELPAKNISRERVRKFPLSKILIHNDLMATLRRALVPKSVRIYVKKKFQMKDRPKMSEAARKKVELVLNEDMRLLGAEFGVQLDVSNYKKQVTDNYLYWVNRENNSQEQRNVTHDGA
ncbi:sulfotransferase domain-containing protein [Microbulbifer sp. SA54]|uniref:sulfotransferase domain-containing protein n=1 Tax=Microbulbifer sp. SA54 TaxID=3401577 RepID=UPI003AAFB83A